jgi:hypothetical protein
MIRPEDDLLHPRDDDPYWNESGWFALMVPERQISGFVYFFHRPNLHYSVGGVALWDPSGDYVWDCLYYDWGDPYPMPGGHEMFDFSLPNGLTVAMAEPMKHFQFTYGEGAHGLYESHGCRMDLTWEAIAGPHDTGLPKGQDEWGSGHYEQPGRMTGTICLGSETIEVDALSHRDRSWGRRRVARNPRANFPWGITSGGHAFHLLAVADAPPDSDDGMGPDRVIAGWHLKEGEYGSIAAGECRTLERAPDGRPLRKRVECTDSLGRRFEAEGRATNMLIWNGYSYLYQWWCQMEWDLDGERAWGEEQDWWPLQQARGYLRARNEQRVLA